MKLKRFKPTFLFKNPHFQTIYPAIFTKFKNLEVELEKFRLSDGDFVECVWHNKPTKNSQKEIVTLFHGLAGGFNSHYIQRAMQTLATKGYSVVLMHFRGCGTKQNLLPRSYHSGESGDAKEWLEELKLRYPNSKLHAVGYSLGGNMLLKLLSESDILTSAIAVSAPMKLDVCADNINSGFSKLYQYHLMKNLKRDLAKKYQTHDMSSLLKLKEEDIKNIKTFWEFDEAYTAPIHGFKDAKDYYEKCSSFQFLKDIKTDTLIIHAKDDPFMTSEVIPTKDEVSSHVELEIYNHGGHVGFVEGTPFKPNYWLEERIINFFSYNA